MSKLFPKSAILAFSISIIVVATGFTAAQTKPLHRDSDSGRLFAKLNPTLNDSAQSHPRQLSWSERIAYQYAIEEVFWRHRIWSKENLAPKPSLDKVISAAQIEKKVEDYLRNSQLLADQWQRPITAEQLQAEMDRMSSQTQQPDVLRELFEALGKDPFVIAECLARPILAERLVSQLTRGADRASFRAEDNEIERSRRSTLDSISRSVDFPRDDSYKLPEVSPLDCINDSWTPTTIVNAPEARLYHTAVWTGSEMIVWGGSGNTGSYLNTGGRYNPSTDSWIATGTTGAPAGRKGHTAVWTGSEMIVWGGYSGSGLLNTGQGNSGQSAPSIPTGSPPPIPGTGGRYDPATDTWRATSITNAPHIPGGHTAVWTGSEMIVWGGEFCCNKPPPRLNTGGRYDPSTDSWTATSLTNAPAARDEHTAVWTGNQMIVWGGVGSGNQVYNNGGRYNPNTNSWTAISLTNAPAFRSLHTAVWTGSQMIVWGGIVFPDSNTGGRYDPSSDSWTATSTTGAPAVRTSHTAVWTGSQMIVWGGYNNGSLNTGGRYDSSSDSWTATSTNNVPAARTSHTAVWTGSQMIVWGGSGSGGPFNTGGRYCAQPSTPIVQSVVSRKTHGTAGSLDVDLPLAGTPGIECRAGGSTNDYSVVVTFASAVTVNGSPQAQVTSGTATVGSGGVSNGGAVTISGNNVTVPLTNVANAQTINVRLNGVTGSSGSGNITIPMSILVGDTNANGAVNAGDVAQTKARIGQALDATNFRSDVIVNGAINATDVAIIKSNIGTGLP